MAHARPARRPSAPSVKTPDGAAIARTFAATATRFPRGVQSGHFVGMIRCPWNDDVMFDVACEPAMTRVPRRAAECGATKRTAVENRVQ